MVLLHIVLLCQSKHTTGNYKGGGEIYEKNTSRLGNHILHRHDKEFTSFLVFLELWNTLQPDNAYEISTEDGIRKRRKANKISGGGRFSDYLLPCHPYGENHPKQREFGENSVALMAHAFTSLSLVDHACFHKLTQDLDPRLCPVGRSKLSQILTPTEKQSMERSVIESL